MPGINSSSNLVELAQQLARQTKEHQQATAEVAATLHKQQAAQAEAARAIDKTLEQVGSLLSALVGGLRSGGAVTVKAPAARPAAAKPKTRRGRAGKFATSGAESVLSFIGSHDSPTASEINAHWKGEGRGAKADNTLGLLVRTKKLKRVANKGGRGSRYALA